MENTELSSFPVRYTVELSDLKRIRAGFIQVIEPAGMLIELTPEEGEGLYAGSLVELSSEIPAAGALRATAKVAAVRPGTDYRGRAILSTSLTFVKLSESQQRVLERHLETVPALVVTLGVDLAAQQQLGSRFNVLKADKCQLFELLKGDSVTALILGSRLAPEEACDILSGIDSSLPSNHVVTIVNTTVEGKDSFKAFVEKGQIFYFSTSALSGTQLCSLLSAALDSGYPVARCEEAVINDVIGERTLDYCGRFGLQDDLPSIGRLLVESLRALLNADDIAYAICDPTSGLLLSSGRTSIQEWRPVLASGLTGYVIRTGERVQVERLDSDSRYDPASDNPRGKGDERFLGHAVHGLGRSVVGVITAIRGGHLPEFSREEEAVVTLVAKHAGIAIAAVLSQNQIKSALAEKNHLRIGSDIYRKEALDARSEGPVATGTVLRVAPLWLTRLFWVTVLFFLAPLLFMIFSRVDEYAVGSAIVRANDKTSVIAKTSGRIRSINVLLGSRVRHGDKLIELTNSGGIGSPEQSAEAVVAPSDGIISSLHVKPGQAVQPGEVLADLTDQAAGYVLIVLMPSRYVSQLHPRMQIVIKPQGYAGDQQVTVIDDMGQEAVAPEDALRFIGRDGPGSGLALAGPVVLLRAHLNSFAVHDGMLFQAEITVNSQRMIFSLLPRMKDMLAR